MPTSPLSLPGRRMLVTGAHDTPRAIADALTAAGASVARIENAFDSEEAVGEAVRSAQASLGGLDQVVHAWMPSSVLEPAAFDAIGEQAWQDGCEAALSGAWWLARQAIAALMPAGGALTFLIPTVGMSGAAEFTMLATVAEGVRVLAKGCGRQLGTEGVTVNAIATAAQLWIGEQEAARVTKATTLSTAAFGRPGDPVTDIAPLVALLSRPEGHFVTANTVVADGGIWMGL